VLIIGETGTGKELAARAIHGLSGRTGGFETINCSGIHEETLESELFGHVKGGFTGATTKRAGRFELASGGTLFLDEIQAMPISLQNKLMRVVEDGKIRRMGSSEDISVDVRLVVATNREPDELVDTGQLRGDLAHRFAAGHRIDLPPLRDRLVDIPALFEWFIRSANKDTGKHVRQTLRPEVRKKLETHPWSGNIRELRGVVTRAVAEANSNVLFASDIKFSVKSSQVGSQAAATSGEAPAIPTVMSSGAGTDLPTVAEMLTDQLEALPLEERYEFLKEQAAGLKKAILTELAYRVHTKYGGKVQYRDLAVALDPGPVNDTVLGRIRQLASSCNFKINNLEFTK
jgi:DNA-binding NtrC family response regulator